MGVEGLVGAGGRGVMGAGIKGYVMTFSGVVRRVTLGNTLIHTIHRGPASTVALKCSIMDTCGNAAFVDPKCCRIGVMRMPAIVASCGCCAVARRGMTSCFAVPSATHINANDP